MLISDPMTLSIYVTGITAIFFFMVGLGAVSGLIKFKRTIWLYDGSNVLCFFVGWASLVIMLMLNEYRYVQSSVESTNMLVSIFVSGTFISIMEVLFAMTGIMLLFFPEPITRFHGLFQRSRAVGGVVLGISFAMAYISFALSSV